LGKNDLGDRNEFLPTAQGFDEWFCNLYHLNEEEEPEKAGRSGAEGPGPSGKV
jgi:arylsulfatase A-like enzyme